MGRRTRISTDDEDIAKLTMEELVAEIARCERRLAIAPNAYQKKAFEKRIQWLKKLRSRRLSE
jgi:hypothetical protein